MIAELVLRTRSPRTQRRDSPCSQGAHSLPTDRDCIRRYYKRKYKHEPVQGSSGQTPPTQSGCESGEGSWTEIDLVYLDSILLCENWSTENHYHSINIHPSEMLVFLNKDISLEIQLKKDKNIPSKVQHTVSVSNSLRENYSH